MSLGAPPDGVIARRYAGLTEGLTDDGRRYLYDCLLRGMRSEPLPDPRPEQRVGKADGILIQQKARHHLHTIERIRAGELPLDEAAPAVPEQGALPF